MDDPNKKNHIFANPDHNLDVLVRHYGSEQEAYRAIVDTVNQAQQDGKLNTNERGLYRQVLQPGDRNA